MKLKEADAIQDVVQLEINIKTLEALFSKGALCATEIRCLNGQSKKQIQKICISSCAKRMEHSVVPVEFCAYCG
ncbi:MAG: hypothetical protein HAW67_00420 [Endozoicomonadaceae bacterium]|nr:hypothetical protein [Endozoicomonadaceae bacterium]